MLDIMGVFALGVELNNLETGSDYSFHDCYHELFDPDPLGQTLMGLNAVLPTGIRWLPLEANRKFKNATGIVHGQLRSIVQQRIAEVERGRDNTVLYDEGEIMDMLTYMVRYKYFAKDGEERWTEQEMLDQVCLPC